jgi:hypothetical protein
MNNLWPWDFRCLVPINILSTIARRPTSDTKPYQTPLPTHQTLSPSKIQWGSFQWPQNCRSLSHLPSRIMNHEQYLWPCYFHCLAPIVASQPSPGGQLPTPNPTEYLYQPIQHCCHQKYSQIVFSRNWTCSHYHLQSSFCLCKWGGDRTHHQSVA